MTATSLFTCIAGALNKT